MIQNEFGLRQIEDGDHAWLIALHNDPEVLKNLTHPEPITLNQHSAWWDSISHDAKQLRMIFTVNGFAAGLTKFYDIDNVNKNCVLGADLHIGYRGQRLAKPMWEMMLRMCFETLDLHRVSLSTAEFNTVAQRVYTGLKFREEGRLTQSLLRDGTYHDQILMYLLRDDWVKI